MFASSDCLQHLSNGENEQTMTYPTCNFVIPKDGTTPTMSYGSYTFKSKMSASLWDMSVSTTSLSINNTARTFVTQTYPVVNAGGYKQIIKNVSSDPASGGYEISNGTFMLSAYDNLPKDFLPNKVFTPTQKDEKGKDLLHPRHRVLSQHDRLYISACGGTV